MYFAGELLTGMQEILGDCRLLAHVLTGKKHQEQAGFSTKVELLRRMESFRGIRKQLQCGSSSRNLQRLIVALAMAAMPLLII